MKFLRYLFWSFLFLSLFIVVVSFFFPSSWKIEKNISIKASPDNVYKYISDLKLWPIWTMWNMERDSSVVHNYSGPNNGEGSMVNWQGDALGKGGITIKETRPPHYLEYDLFLGDNRMRSNGFFSLKKSNKGTKINWHVEGNLGLNPLNRVSGIFMEHWLGSDFELGLKNLKCLVEKKYSPDLGHKVNHQ